ncbi:hypothetical protein CJJ09_003753 [Candidozyma auris]|nr:hypothetical protein CJJ09_003753 [[Candida] auris]
MSHITEGSSLTVGSHAVKVVRFLSEGGFSKIYEVSMDPPHDDTDIGCLKQVIVPDKSGLNALRKEVDVMKTLHSAKHIVRYYDSNAERLPDGQYQVLVLMELCPNKSLLEYMNARIRTKLTEKEILKIMMDITLGLYEMHKLKLIHRDVKIENVLIDAHHVFKLCDFGSVSVPIRPPKDQREFQLLSHDILYQTTPQYRSPEMVDLYRAQPIDEKSDIWALGCFLYKLCYYTTPFEATGDIAILHASFQFLPQPEFSGDLKNLIIIMLQENPLYRPNVVQILMLLCKMTGKDIEEYEIEDFYHAGPYNFQALHQMQQQKQEELRKQQQLYYEQQKQQQEYEMRKLKAQQATAAGGPHRTSSQKSTQHLENASPSVFFDIPTAIRFGPIGPSSSCSSPYPYHVASQVPKPASVPPQSIPPVASPVQQSQPYSRSDSQSNLAKLSKTQSNNPFPIQSAVEHADVADGTTANDSDIDLDELSKLANAEERYPSLDALNDEADKVSRKSSEYGDRRDVQAGSRKHSQDPETKRPSDLESTSAWEKPSSHIDKDAEKLVNDIFVTRTGPSETKSTSLPSSSAPSTTVSSKQPHKPQVEQRIVDDSGKAGPNDVPTTLDPNYEQFANGMKRPSPLQGSKSMDASSQAPNRMEHQIQHSYSVGPSLELDRNLIELEVGLSSGESSDGEKPPPLPPHPAPKQREEAALVDLDGTNEKRKPKMKKSLSQTPAQPFAVKEEVIDFASDDENQQSEMSRLSIRNSFAIKLLTIEGKVAYDLMNEPLLVLLALTVFERLMGVSGASLIGKSPDASLETLSEQTVAAVQKLGSSPVTASLVWWRARALQVHLSVLSEPSDALASITSLLLQQPIVNWLVGTGSCDAEAFGAAVLKKAAEVSQLQFALTGAKAKRTKFQTFHTAQLILLAKSAESNVFGTDAKNEAPESFELNSDLLLEKPEFESLADVDMRDDQANKKIKVDSQEPASENSGDHRLFPVALASEVPEGLKSLDPNSQPALNDLDNIQLLLRLTTLKQTTPSGNTLVDEELAAVVDRIVYASGSNVNWLVFGRALWERSVLETGKARTVERGILQMTSLVEEIGIKIKSRVLPQAEDQTSASVASRLRFVHQLPLMASWSLDAKLAEKYMSLGVLKSAIAIYERLGMPVEAALCYAAVEEENVAEKILLESGHSPRGRQGIQYPR